MKSSVLKEIIIDAMKDILDQKLGVDETYLSIKRLFLLDEFELRVLFSSIQKIKERQIEEKRRELAK